MLQRPLTKLLLSIAVFTVFLFGSDPGSHGLLSAPRKPVFSSPHSTRPQAASRTLTPVSVRAGEGAPDARGFRLPVYFDRNEGQTARRVLYTAHDLGYSLFLTHAGATIVFASPAKSGSNPATATVRHFSLAFLGASTHAEVLGEDELPGESNYFSGSDPRLWYTHVPQFAKVRYRDLYPGVDIVFYSRHGRLEYDLEAAPGANIPAIRMEVSDAKLSHIAHGGIALRSGSAEFELQRPRVYQEGKKPRLIHAAYSVHGNQLSFLLPGYIPARPVVIDPALIFATYLSSNCSTCMDALADSAADASGVYIAGNTPANTFPATEGGPQPISQDYQTFVVKLDPSGTSILYASYLASSEGVAVAVDSTGSAYVSGTADLPSPSGVPSFPLTQGVFSNVVPPGSPQWFVPFAAKLSADGASILYSTLLQQPTSNGTLVATPVSIAPVKVAVDSQGALYVTGSVATKPTETSVWMPLPVTQGAYQSTPGNLFAMKLTPNASGLEYSTYFDGTAAQGDRVNDIAVDSSGDAFLAGTATMGFPTTSGAYQTNPSGTGLANAFVFELNPAGTNPVYSTFFGSSGGNSFGVGIAIDSQDQAVVVGSGVNPPVTANAFCGDVGGAGIIGYVAKFNAAGSALVYSTTLCTVDSGASAVAIDASGNAYVTGAIQYPASFQPFIRQAIKSYYETYPGVNPPSNMQVAFKLDPSGNILWSTFLGLSEIDANQYLESRIELDPSDAVYLLYNSADFPTTPGAVGLSHPSPNGSVGYFDFLLKISPSLGEPVGLAMPNAVTFPAQNVGTSSTAVDVQAGNYGDATMTPAISISGDFSETETCGTPVPPGGECDVQVVFTPTATGTRSGALNLNFGGLYPTETVPLTGSGTQPAVSLSPTSLSFGQQATGTTSGAQQVTLTNTGTGPLTITSIQTTKEFAATNTCGGTVAVGASCTVQVTFTPTASGSQTGTLTIGDNAANSPQTVSLKGNQPPTFSLSSGSSAVSATVTPGRTATYNFNLTPANEFTGTVNFTCTGAPSEAACSVSPNPANVTGTSSVAISASVTTQAASTLYPFTPNPSTPTALFEYLVAAVVLLSILLLCFPPARLKLSWKTASAVLAILLMLAAAAACGGSSQRQPSNPGTPAGIYTLTVTGASGSISQSIQLTLNVN